MFKTKDGEYFTSNRIVGKGQLSVTVPMEDWKLFPIGGRAKVFSVRKKIINITRKIISSSGNDRQRVITIPAADHDLFKYGDLVKIFPIPSVFAKDVAPNVSEDIDTAGFTAEKETEEEIKTAIKEILSAPPLPPEEESKTIPEEKETPIKEESDDKDEPKPDEPKPDEPKPTDNNPAPTV
jgi:hypothetical protein